MTASADEGIGQALSSQLVAAIEQNYSATPVPFRKIRFNYSRNNEVLAKEVQYFIYGTYTFIADGNVSLTANVVNIGSNEQRSFSAPLSSAKSSMSWSVTVWVAVVTVSPMRRSS